MATIKHVVFDRWSQRLLLCQVFLANLYTSTPATTGLFRDIGSGFQRMHKPPNGTELQSLTGVTKITDCCRKCVDDVSCLSVSYSSSDSQCLTYNQTWTQDECDATEGWQTLVREVQECENNGTWTLTRGCQCSGGYTGDRCQRLVEDCYEARFSGHYPNLGRDDQKVLLVHPRLAPNPIQVRCLGSGGTFFQLRHALDVSFNRSWDEYVAGFGNFPADFWMGLQDLYYFTNSYDYKMAAILITGNLTVYRMTYNNFVLTENVTYTATFGNLASSDVGDEMSDMREQKFSTYDNDNDNSTTRNCAAEYGGGWWFDACSSVNMNGRLLTSDTREGDLDEVFWDALGLQAGKGVSLRLYRMP